MNKLSFRARALDASKPMPIYMSEELPDLPEYSAINRAVPQMPSGMEKEEECEHHLQRAMVAGLIIPTPEVINIKETNKCLPYNLPPYKVPRQLIHVQPFTMEQDIPDYDIDSEDEVWLKQQVNGLDITPLKFEEIMDRLEKNSGYSVVTQSEAKALLKEDDDLIIAVYDYWLNKRLITQTPLIPSVKTEGHRGGNNNNNPYIAFRRRTEKMQTRKNRKNDETSYEKMVKLRRDLSRALTLLELVSRREKSKKELLHLIIEIYEKRYQIGDFNGHLLAEVAAIKYSRPAFTPLLNNQYSTPQNNSVSWSKPVKDDFFPRKDKRPSRKRKHKNNSLLPAFILSPTDTVSKMLTSYNDESQSSIEENRFTFHRNKLCNYQAPVLEKLGNWPWCSLDEGGFADPKFKYSLTSLSTPIPRCIGFARRRLGRGGRVLLDRAGPPMDDYWEKMDFTILDSSKTKDKSKINSTHYHPKEKIINLCNSNYLTLEIEDLSDSSDSKNLTDVKLNISELFPSISDTFLQNGNDLSTITELQTNHMDLTSVESASNLQTEKIPVQSVSASKFIVLDDKSDGLGLSLNLKENTSNIDIFKNKKYSSGSLLDRWAKFENVG